MRRTRSVALLVTLTVVGLTVALLASGAVANTFAAADAGGSQSDSTNASVGTVMQASAADTANGVESGMFDAAYERADNESRAAVVSERTDALETKVTALENERVALESRRGELSTGAYRSQMARLTVQIAFPRADDRTNGVPCRRGRHRQGSARGTTRERDCDPPGRFGARRTGCRGGRSGSGRRRTPDDAGPTGRSRRPPVTTSRREPGETATGNGSGASNGSDAGTDPNGRSSGNGADERSPGAPSTDPDEPDGESNDGSDTDSGTPSGADTPTADPLHPGSNHVDPSRIASRHAFQRRSLTLSRWIPPRCWIYSGTKTGGEFSSYSPGSRVTSLRFLNTSA